MLTIKRLLFVLVLLVTSINIAWACGHPPPPPTPTSPPPKVWMIDHGIDPITNMSSMWFGVEIDPILFPISSPTLCTCAIGLGGLGLPTIPSLNVTSAMIAVTNMVTKTVGPPVPGFEFTPDGAITADAEANAILPGQQWSGLSTTVNPPVIQPILGPNEVLKLWFDIQVDPADILTLRQATTGTLLGFSIGGSPNDPQHAPEQFLGFKVPTPGSVFLLGLGGVMMFLSRYKKLTA
ncbi:hypothetical protein [Flocculibacter collagenilyticus]|uniref:hypothetical protein n=1 Tax=Flocculibacter collagenilyticus TaxID=2744479 RepID=UPI0018F36C25|nr:hypothetical protein [Flocculibacter collagenilyticus]